MPTVPKGNLDATVAALQHEAAVQAESAAAWDAKLMGILAFMAAAAGLLLTLDEGSAVIGGSFSAEPLGLRCSLYSV